MCTVYLQNENKYLDGVFYNSVDLLKSYLVYHSGSPFLGLMEVSLCTEITLCTCDGSYICLELSKTTEVLI